MKKIKNIIHIEGWVHSFGGRNGRNALAEKETGPKSKAPGTKYIGGIINIATDDAGLNVIPVNFTYITATTSKGAPSSTYKALKQILDENKTWISCGKDGAQMVKIDCSLGLNDFTDANGQFVSSKVCSGSFVTLTNELLPEDERNTFDFDMVITNTKRVVPDDENKVKEEYVELRGATFDYRNALLPFSINIKKTTGMDYFENCGASASEPLFTEVRGRILNETVTTTIERKSAWGESVVDTVNAYNREWLCTWSSEFPYEFGEEGVLTVEELKTAMQNRQVHLAEVKKQAEDYKASQAAAPAPAPQIKNEDFNF